MVASDVVGSVVAPIHNQEVLDAADDEQARRRKTRIPARSRAWCPPKLDNLAPNVRLLSSGRAPIAGTQRCHLAPRSTDRSLRIPLIHVSGRTSCDRGTP